MQNIFNATTKLYIVSKMYLFMSISKNKMVFFYVLGSIAVTCSARKLHSTDYIKQLTPFK